VAREYPDFPVVGVGGVVVQDGKVLIVKRAHEPRKQEWSLPGGCVELGESLRDATRREIREETGIDVEVGALIELFDRVHEHDGRVQYHFVIADYLCTPRDGRLAAADDAIEVAWVKLDELDTYGVNEHAQAVIRKALNIKL
jgi:8-oxo-dGTP diphosphatase